MGLVFVLLLGEIDLSAGYTAGVSGAMLGVASTAARLALAGCGARLPRHRRRDRRDHRAAGLAGRHPVVRRDPGDVPRPAGTAAADHRRGRHDPDPERHDPRDHEQEPAGLGRLGALPRHHDHLCRGDLPPARGAASQGAGGPVDDRLAGEDRLPGDPARPVHLLPEHRAQPERGDQLDQGRAVRHPRAARPAGRADVPAHPDQLRAARLRGRRQRRGGTPGRHQRAGHQARLLHHLLHGRRDRRHPAGQPGQLDHPEHRWWRDAALRRRRGRHRRHQPVRRQGPSGRRHHRRPRGRRRRQRHGPAQQAGRRWSTW